MTEADKTYIRIWYWSGAALVFLILIIGGITRLTQSGLSMVEWRPLFGVIPPLSEADWAETFEKYRAYPEYQQLNRGMSLEEFKFIFFWEYLHRMAGRLIGLVFLIPFGWFAATGKFSSKQLKRALILLVLGLGQGFLGWFMVQSGLVDVPYVSPYRLAAHLLLAFLIFGCCVWFALDLYPEGARRVRPPGFALKGWIQAFLVLLVLQIAWGAFVAGHNAGHIYNTFPKMNQFWIPPEAWLMEPFVRNLFENSAAVQWIHRLLGSLLGIMAVFIWLRTLFSNTDDRTRFWVFTVFLLILIQYATGVYTLLFHVPLTLAVLHQGLAMILFGVVINLLHRLETPIHKATIT